MKINIILILVFLGLLSSCKKVSEDCKNANYTYDTHIKTIIDNNCNTMGCHTHGASIGDFTTYSSLEKYLKNGKFNIQVFFKKEMPKGKTLSEQDYTMLECWYDTGFDKN